VASVYNRYGPADDSRIGYPWRLAGGGRADRIAVRADQLAAPSLVSTATGKDGRCPAPLMAAGDFHAGRYALTFYLADYFRGRGVELPNPPFIEEAVIRIGIAQIRKRTITCRC
jgi:5-hydroxyisourate hydrolase-like protein (transthyretin family)